MCSFLYEPLFSCCILLSLLYRFLCSSACGQNCLFQHIAITETRMTFSKSLRTKEPREGKIKDKKDKKIKDKCEVLWDPESQPHVLAVDPGQRSWRLTGLWCSKAYHLRAVL